MKSALPKVLHQVAGASLVSHAIRSADELSPDRIVVVVGHGAEKVGPAVAKEFPKAETVVQEERLGTAHAVDQARAALEGFEGDAVVLYGDTPFIRGETLREMLKVRQDGADVVVLGFDANPMQEVLGLTATRAAGLKTQFGTMGKPYNAGLAASAGIEAALLIKRGFEPNASALEGQYGFGATHQGAAAASAALDGLGEEWLFESVSHKFHACCHGLHAALEAALRLDIAEPEVAEIKVKTHPRWMSVCNQMSPTTGLGAKFSYRTVIAMQALGYDTALPSSYTEKVCADPRIRSLRDRITVEADETLTETQAHLELLRRDGVRREVTHDLMAPMSLADREDRVRAKASKLIGGAEADAIWSMLRTGGHARDLAAKLAG